MTGPKGWHGRGYLPHFDSPETIQHVVFRTVGSLPERLREDLPRDVAPRRASIDRALDLSTSGLVLRSPEAAAVVEETLLYFDGVRYRLLAWCIMPSHVHVVLEQQLGWSLGQIVRSWKLFSTRALNKLNRTSGPVWAPDYFDRYVRNESDLERTVAYVEANPVKAKLAENPGDWAFSSARFRSV